MASAHYAEHMCRIQIGLSLEIEKNRCVCTFSETGWIIGITYIIKVNAVVFNEAKLLFGPPQHLRILDTSDQRATDARNLCQRCPRQAEDAFRIPQGLQQLTGEDVSDTLHHS